MHLDLMRLGLYTSWLLPLSLPFLMAALFRQAWRSRVGFVVVGVLLVLGVCVASFLLSGFVLMPLYQAVGIDTSLRKQGPVSHTHAYLNLGFGLLANVLVSYGLLRWLAPLFACRSTHTQ